jgi:ParB family transcriptional regulator, chromosome partitioning protein
VRIANGDDSGLQDALLQGYESGELRGDKLRAVRKIIRERNSLPAKPDSPPTKAMTGSELANLFKQRVHEQQRLVRKADQAKDRLLVLVPLMRELLADEDFVTLLRAESIMDLPAPLSTRLDLGGMRARTS